MSFRYSDYGLDVQGDGLASQGLDENLHMSTEKERVRKIIAYSGHSKHIFYRLAK